VRWIDPVPPQMSQVCSDVPGAQQLPWQVSHSTAVWMSRSRLLPKMTSSRSSSTRSRASWPRSLRDRGPRWLPPPPPCGRTEEGLEDVAEATEPAGAGAERALAAEVVLLALLGVAEHVVGVRHQLELVGRIRTRIDVGVKLARQLAIGALDVVSARVAIDAEHFVMVSHLGSFLLNLRRATW
jgi:hypothetical protein